MTFLTSSKLKVLVLIVSLLLLDLITKFYANNLLPLYTEGPLNLTYFSENISLLLVHHYKGMEAMGMSHSFVLFLMAILAAYLLFESLYSQKDYKRYSFAVYLGGYGNVVEIAYHDYATDFLHFQPLNELLGGRIYIFNIADIIIPVSLIILFSGLLYDLSTKIFNYCKSKKVVESSF